MRVFRSLDNLPAFKNAVLTIGTFDGVHLGHQYIIRQLKKMAQDCNGETILLTFHPHPRLVVNPDDDSLRLLNTLDEKIELLEKYGIDNLVVIPFTKAFANTRPEDYVKELLWEKFHPHTIVIGYDHKFGKNRKGDIQTIQSFSDELDFRVIEIEKQLVNDIAVSSTKVRKALFEGAVDKAMKMLGHPYSITGQVQEGDKIGRTLGYPTANIQIEDKNKLVPADGIYCAKVWREKDQSTHLAMLSIGLRPTINDKKIRSLEVYLLNFNEDLYGETLKVEFYKYLRSEKKFDNLEDLVKAMDKDKEATIAY
ncbi:MAG: bifunctional riboflavin kinase/FAD synthetase, partial [Chitinophagales bacterium]